jgi:hypothetical protein
MLARINLQRVNGNSATRRWRSARIVLLVAGLSAVLTGTTLAAVSKMSVSKTAPPVLIGRGQGGYSVNVQLLVDSHGTVNAVWQGTSGSHYVAKYARKTAKASSFTQVALPDGATPAASNNNPFIFQLSSGVLEIFVGNFDSGFAAWRSTNDGASWTTMDTTALNAFSPQGIYLASSGMAQAPGGPVLYAGNDGDPAAEIVQMKSDFSGVTQIATNTAGFDYPELARALDGTLYMVGGAGSSDAITYQVGSATGTVTFPCATGYGLTPNADNGTETLAAGRSVAIVAFAGCKHVWTRTITPGGVVGPLTTIGSSPRIATSGVAFTGSPWVAVSADTRGGFTAAFVVPGGDLAVAHSSDGSHWTTAPGFVPVANWVTPDSRSYLSAGATTWYTSDGEGLPLSDTYKQPPAPPASGVADPGKVHRLGSLAAVVPRAVALKSFRHDGETTMSVVDAIGGPVTVSVADSRASKAEDLIVCQGGIAKPTKLAADKPQTLKLSCGAGGGITLGGSGGTVSKAIDAHKGDLFVITINDRGQTLTLPVHVG